MDDLLLRRQVGRRVQHQDRAWAGGLACLLSFFLVICCLHTGGVLTQEDGEGAERQHQEALGAAGPHPGLPEVGRAGGGGEGVTAGVGGEEVG